MLSYKIIVQRLKWEHEKNIKGHQMSKKPTKGKNIKHWKTHLHFEVWKLIKSMNWRRENVCREEGAVNMLRDQMIW